MSTRATYRSGARGRLRDNLERCAGLILIAAVSTACLSFALPPAVAITRLSDLGVGDVGMNSTKQVSYADAGAASFRIDVTGFVAQTGITITLTLPAQLSSGGSNVPVTFATTNAAWNYLDAPATATVFNPNAGTTIPKNGANFSAYVWIGAEVDATGSPPSAQYSNSLTLIADAL